MSNKPIVCAKDGIDITGCRVSLYPMKDHFAQQILTSIEKTNTSAVWQQTDLFSTLFRGGSAQCPRRSSSAIYQRLRIQDTPRG